MLFIRFTRTQYNTYNAHRGVLDTGSHIGAIPINNNNNTTAAVAGNTHNNSNSGGAGGVKGFFGGPIAPAIQGVGRK